MQVDSEGEEEEGEGRFSKALELAQCLYAKSADAEDVLDEIEVTHPPTHPPTRPASQSLSQRLLSPHPPTHPQSPGPHSNSLVLLYHTQPPTHPPTHPHRTNSRWANKTCGAGRNTSLSSPWASVRPCVN